MKDYLTVKELATLAGISVRTLHYYDEIGLYKPDTKSEANYRLYSSTNIDRLWLILFLKELDIPLSKIRILVDNGCDKRDLLNEHRKLLLLKRDRINRIIASIDKTIMKGFDVEMIKAFDKKEYYAYKDEVLEKYGEIAREAFEKTDKYDDDKFKSLNAEMNNIFRALSRNMDKGYENEVVQGLVKELQNHITKNYYECTNEILGGLGKMYVCDTRFKNNIDSIESGLAEFVSKAIEFYVEL